MPNGEPPPRCDYVVSCSSVFGRCQGDLLPGAGGKPARDGQPSQRPAVRRTRHLEARRSRPAGRTVRRVHADVPVCPCAGEHDRVAGRQRGGRPPDRGALEPGGSRGADRAGDRGQAPSPGRDRPCRARCPGPDRRRAGRGRTQLLRAPRGVALAGDRLLEHLDRLPLDRQARGIRGPRLGGVRRHAGTESRWRGRPCRVRWCSRSRTSPASSRRSRQAANPWRRSGTGRSRRSGS